MQAWSAGGEGKYSSPEREFRFGEFFFSAIFWLTFFLLSFLDNEGRLLIRKFIYLFIYVLQ